MNNYGHQIGVIAYDKHGARGSFAASHIADARARGYTVVLRGGYATIHR